MDTPSIAPRFCGPPSSGNGGYACGLAAAVRGSVDGATVRLLAPPPLGEPLDVLRDEGSVTLAGRAGPCLEARPGIPAVTIPDPVTVEEAERLAAGFDVADYHDSHVFPGCFTCGPERSPGDGLRLFPAPAGRDGLVVWPWTPTGEWAGDDGRLDPLVIWAALDCPSGMAHIRGDGAEQIDGMVLGQLSVRIERRAEIDAPLVVAGWPVDGQGRRRTAGSVVWDAAGEVVARAEAVWIVLTAEQLAAFTL